MNRLLQEDLSSLFQHTEEISDEGQGPFVETKARSHYRFFSPLHYEKNYPYPLLVWLHGPGGTEAELKYVMPHVSLRNYVGVSIRGVIKDPRGERLQREAYTWNQTASCVDQAFDRIMDGIRFARDRFHIGGNERVFLVGNDVGGTMALRLALSAPQEFGGVISLGGAMPHSRQPLAEIHRARSLPVFIAHCRESSIYPTDSMCNDLRLLHAAGMRVNLRQYPCSQEVTTKMLSDVNEWMMEQVVGPQSMNPSRHPTHLRLHDKN